MARRTALALLITGLSAGLAGCGTTASRGSDGASRTLNVFAAASLDDAFGELIERFQTVADISVTANYAGSTTLATQVTEGAPADVLATADETSMRRVGDVVQTAPPVVFATNSMTILVAPGNPLGIKTVRDLAAANIVVAACAARVPCGAYAAQVFDRAGAEVSPRSLDGNVVSVVTKVVNGEADAGIVYVTDAIAAGQTADSVPIPAEHNAVGRYEIATVGPPRTPAAQAFVDFVAGPTGHEVLSRHGFGSP